MTENEAKKVKRQIKRLNLANSFLNKPIIESVMFALYGYSLYNIPAMATLTPEYIATLVGGTVVGLGAHYIAYKKVSCKLAELEYKEKQYEIECNSPIIFEDEKTKQTNKELQEAITKSVYNKQSLGYASATEPTIENRMYAGEIKEELLDEWRLYLATADVKYTDFNATLYFCLEELKDGILIEDLINYISDVIPIEYVMKFICLLVHFSPRGDELKEYWDNKFFEHKIEEYQLIRTK